MKPIPPYAETAQSAQIPSEPISVYCANCAGAKLNEKCKDSVSNNDYLNREFETHNPHAETAQYTQILAKPKLCRPTKVKICST